MPTAQQYKRPTIGVSACLLGNQVRFDGGHKNNKYITDTLKKHLDLVPVCPETEIGLGIPRPPIQLRVVDSRIRLVVSKSPDIDLTERMEDYAAEKTVQLGELDGFIFKKDSPSCGVYRVPVVFNKEGYRSKDGVGLFAKKFLEAYPLIPVEEEGRLNDHVLRENFFERVFSYRRWKEMLSTANTVQGLMDFHGRHKLLLMARGSTYYSELGRLVAASNSHNLSEQQAKYIQQFMQTMSRKTCRGQQVNVMMHLLGHMKKMLTREDKKELLSVFEAYRNPHLPLITPITLLRHHVRSIARPYLSRQHYLEPYPEDLALRSFI